MTLIRFFAQSRLKVKKKSICLLLLLYLLHEAVTLQAAHGGSALPSGVNLGFNFSGESSIQQNHLDIRHPGESNSINGREEENVVMVIDSSDYELLQSVIEVYIGNVESRFDVELSVESGTWNSAEQVRAFLKDLYDNAGLAGAVLVGELPYGLWYASPGLPNPLFFEDLDGVFMDIGHQPGTEADDGIYDYYDPQESDPVEIWMTFIRAQINDPAPGAALNAFFEKCNAYYAGNAIYPKRALIHCHSSYPSAANPGSPYREVLTNIYGDDLFIEGGTLRFPYPNLDMLNHLRKGYEIVDPWSHGSSGSHGLHTTEIQGLEPPRSLITVSWSCSAANFNNCPDNLAVGYVLGNSYGGGGNEAYSDGQIFIGAGRAVGTENHHIFYEALEAGQHAGASFKSWLDHQYNEENIIYSGGSYHPWNFVFMGNPFIRLNEMRIDRIDPFFAFEGEGSIDLVVTGRGFDEDAMLRLTDISNLNAHYFCSVTAACSSRIEAHLNETLPPGIYHVTATNPGGESASLVDHFHVITDGDSDEDGLSDLDELFSYLSSPFNEDTDGDLISDGDETSGILNVHYGYQPTDPTDPDSDGDNFCSDSDEINCDLYYGYYCTDPVDWDTDNDRHCDGCENNPLAPDAGPFDQNTDSDGDGLTDKEENYPYKTFPVDMDSDSDGIDDGDERDYWEARSINPAGDIDRDMQRNLLDFDSDNDNLQDGAELIYGTLPDAFDTDDDGMPDGWEVSNCLNPLTDDADEDLDADGLTNLQEYESCLNPNDGDNDGMQDGWENSFGLNPTLDDSGEDPDEDGFSNVSEFCAETNPVEPLSFPGSSVKIYYVDGENGNDVYSGSAPALGCFAGPWKTIDHAVAQLGPGAVCRVRSGTYCEQVDDFINNGSSDQKIILSGYIDGADGHLSVWPDSTTLPVIDAENTRGCCIKTGHKQCSHWIFQNLELKNGNAWHGNFFNFQNNPVVLNNMIIHGNSSGSDIGGNVHNYLTGGYLELNDCIIHGAASHGVVQYKYSQTVLNRCIIYGNQGSGVHMALGMGGAIEMNSVIIHGNQNGLDGAWENLSILNCTIADNESYGIYNEDIETVTVVKNNIVSGNETGIRIETDSADLDYNNVWNNSTDWFGTTLAGSHSISENPLFIDESNNDYHLRCDSPETCSPCIDTGCLNGPSFDFEGDERPVDGDENGTVDFDIGADEFIPVNFTPVPASPTPAETSTPASPSMTPTNTNTPSPETPSQTPTNTPSPKPPIKRRRNPSHQAR